MSRFRVGDRIVSTRTEGYAVGVRGELFERFAPEQQWNRWRILSTPGNWWYILPETEFKHESDIVALSREVENSDE